MSFTKVIKASKPQQSISSFVACCQQKGFQPQTTANSVTSELSQGSFLNHRDLSLKKSRFWQNDTPGTFIHRFLLQNIFSLNSLSNTEKHDFSEFQSEEFVHCLQIEDEEVTSGIAETETVKSEYMESFKQSYGTISDSQSVFEFQFINDQIIENRA